MIVSILTRRHAAELVEAALNGRSTKDGITYEGLSSVVERLLPDGGFSAGMGAAVRLLSEIPGVKKGRRAGREIWKFDDEAALRQALADIM